MALTVQINSHIIDHQWLLFLVVGGISLFRTSAVDRFVVHVSISHLTLDAITRRVPISTMLDDLDTNVLPCGAALETLSAGEMLSVPILAQAIFVGGIGSFCQ